MGNLEGLKGCGTALITPFLSDGKLDEKALAALVDWQIREGIHFLVPCGTTGESPTLKHDEHLAVVDITVRTAAGRVPVIAGAGGNDTYSAPLPSDTTSSPPLMLTGTATELSTVTMSLPVPKLPSTSLTCS